MSIVNNKIVWEDKYSTGIQLIDDQHKKMFDDMNKLMDLARLNTDKKKLTSAVQTLIADKKFHAETEEAYFREFNYELAEDHIIKHRAFGKKLDELKEKSEDNALIATIELLEALENWLIGHIMFTDSKYVPCFKEHGLK